MKRIQRSQSLQLLVALVAAMFTAAPLHAQQTVGLFQNDAGTTDGYVFFGPASSTKTYLIDNCGRLVHTWQSGYVAGPVVKFNDDGTVLRGGVVSNPVFGATGGAGGRVEILDWDGSVLWHYQISDSNQCSHHDILLLPNGNVLMTVWERFDSLDAVNQGRSPATLAASIWPEKIVEVQPTTPGNGNIVWEWHVWDHLVQDFDSTKPNYGVVADHPELFDLNYYNPIGEVNWFHVNGLGYNADRDEISFSSHRWGEIFIIDHSTTTQEAAGHTGGNRGKGGDLLYRYGNPRTYDRGTVSDQKFFGQHNIEWVPAGDPYAGMLKVFNNGLGRPAGAYSTLEIWQPPLDSLGNYVIDPGMAYGPSAPAWTYMDNPGFYSSFVSGFDRLPNGNTFVCAGALGEFFELDTTETVVWSYVNPVIAAGPVNQGDTILNNGNIAFRATRIASGHPGLTGRDLTPGDRLEGNPLPLPSNCTGSAIGDPASAGIAVFPNPVRESLTIRRSVGTPTTVEVRDMQGRVVLRQRLSGLDDQCPVGGLTPGLYVLQVPGSPAVKFCKL